MGRLGSLVLLASVALLGTVALTCSLMHEENPKITVQALADCQAGADRGVVPEDRIDECALRLTDARVYLPEAFTCDFVGRPSFCVRENNGSIRTNNWMLMGSPIIVPATALSQPPVKF